jgi:hypothetical protein
MTSSPTTGDAAEPGGTADRGRSSGEDAVQQASEGPALTGRPDRREHGGMPPRMDDDDLALRTERERVEAGLQDYVPEDVPPATDAAPAVDVTETEQYQEELATIRRQQDEGDLRPLDSEHPFPPTRYDEQQPETD